MESQRPCVCCGKPFELNPRSRSTHRFCRARACQRERKRRAQKQRRASEVGGRASRAEYMRRYRAQRPDYRQREAERAAARRAQARAPSPPEVVAPSPGAAAALPASVKVVGAPAWPEVQVVTEAGVTLRLAVEVACEGRRNEAG